MLLPLVVILVVTASARGQECLHGFALSETCSGNVNTCSRELGNQYHVRLFPSLSFTCNGTLSGWSATGCTQGDDPRLYPWLQIWRPEGAMSYSRVASESGDCSSAEYLDCTFQPAISIMADDVVGLVLFTKNSANFRVYFSNSEPKTTNYIFYDETATSVMFTDGSEDRPPLIAMDFTSVHAPTPDSTTATESSTTATTDTEPPTATLSVPTAITSEAPTPTNSTAQGPTASEVPAPTDNSTAESPTPPTPTNSTAEGPTASEVPAPTDNSTAESPTFPTPTNSTAEGPTTSEVPAPTTSSTAEGPTTSEVPAPTTSSTAEGPTTSEVPAPTTSSTAEGPTTSEVPAPTTSSTAEGPTTSEVPAPTTSSTVSEVQPEVSPTPTVDSATSAQNETDSPSSVGTKSSTVHAVVGGLLTVTIIAVVILLAVVFALIIARKRERQQKIDSSSYETAMVAGIMDNPNYTNTNLVMSLRNEVALSLIPVHDGGREYESVEQSADCPSLGAYENMHTTGTMSQWGVVVPNQEQRDRLASRSSQLATTTDNMYSDLHDEPVPANFFEECAIYWAPSTKANELYQQLAKRKYREILRPHIQIHYNQHLGSGQFGTVSKGLWQSPAGAMEVAVKTFKAGSPEEDKVKFLQEAAINGQFHHPNIVQLMGVVTVGEPVMIVLELLANGDLREFLLKQRPDPGQLLPTNTNRLLLKFCQQVASGMEYLARKAFVHRDLAARNILVADDKICKISDFGMSRDLMDDSYYVSHGGKIPVKWTAPEAINYKKYSTASDVWSFGAVMYEIWSLGHKPFEDYSNVEVIQLVLKGFRLPPPPGCPREVYKLMINCWHPDRASRPSFAQMVETLSQPHFDLLMWREADTKLHPQVTVVGAPLEAAENLYPELQKSYASRN